MSEFFSMGGYAFYVWTSYGVFALALIWTTLSPLLRKRAVIQRIQDRIEREKRNENHDTET